MPTCPPHDVYGFLPFIFNARGQGSKYLTCLSSSLLSERHTSEVLNDAGQLGRQERQRSDETARDQLALAVRRRLRALQPDPFVLVSLTASNMNRRSSKRDFVITKRHVLCTPPATSQPSRYTRTPSALCRCVQRAVRSAWPFIRSDSGDLSPTICNRTAHG